MILHLSLKGEYFHAIRDGTKKEEYRLATDYWKLRLQDREYTGIELTLGYPKRGDTERRISRPWRGCRIQTLQHPHFGPEPVQVFAIPVNP